MHHYKALFTGSEKNLLAKLFFVIFYVRWKFCSFNAYHKQKKNARRTNFFTLGLNQALMLFITHTKVV